MRRVKDEVLGWMVRKAEVIVGGVFCLAVLYESSGTSVPDDFETTRSESIERAVCLGNSNDQDRGVVVKLAAAEIGDAVQQAPVKRLGR
jgi:hypothetical protein